MSEPAMEEIFDLAIIGAGPAGLACALHAGRRGLKARILEKGTVANTIVGYPTGMRFFSTTDRLELADIPFTSIEPRPTRVEAISYYQGIARRSGLDISVGNRVHGVRRLPEGGFDIDATVGCHARNVVLATGYFDQTNRLNVPGEDLPHVHYYYREPYPFYGLDVVVVGGRNSAVETALDLYRHGARVTIIHRGDRFGDGVKYWIRPDIENRVADGSISVIWNSRVREITSESVIVGSNETGELQEIPCRALIAHIGYRPDQALLDACGIAYEPVTLVPDYDPVTLETNVPDLYLAGSVACGCQTWEIFIENSREHAITVVEEILRRGQGGAGLRLHQTGSI